MPDNWFEELTRKMRKARWNTLTPQQQTKWVMPNIYSGYNPRNPLGVAGYQQAGVYQPQSQINPPRPGEWQPAYNNPMNPIGVAGYSIPAQPNYYDPTTGQLSYQPRYNPILQPAWTGTGGFPYSPQPTEAQDNIGRDQYGYRQGFNELMKTMTAQNKPAGWYGEDDYAYDSQAEALAAGNKNVLYYSPTYGTGPGKNTKRNSTGRPSGGVGNLSQVLSYIGISTPDVTQWTLDEINKWFEYVDKSGGKVKMGGAFEDRLRKKQQKLQAQAGASGAGSSGNSSGGTATWS